ncbi:MAG: formimidoylglutamase [Bacteroidia bacterium]
MDLSMFFDPVEAGYPRPESRYPDTWGRHVPVYQDLFPEWEEADVLLIGICEARDMPEMAPAADAIRQRLADLSLPADRMRVADLGNLKGRETAADYHELLAYVLRYLFGQGKTVLLIGGSQDIVMGQYLACDVLPHPIEYAHIDARFDLEDATFRLDRRSFNHQLLFQPDGHLFHYTNLGYQRFVVSDRQRRQLAARHFAALRYGELTGRIEEAEPYLRMADLVAFDMSAVRMQDAPAAADPSPGGFTALEACRLARYAGLGYRTRSFSLTEICPALDQREQTVMLGAMLCWYFVEGYYSRLDDYPLEDRSNLRKYSVRLHASVEVIDFFRHPGSERWWMEVPYPEALNQPARRRVLVPCSRRDYEFAQGDDIPERWWLTFNKLQA